MYERNAIVLERYFNKLFKFNENSNLRDNYKNYCKLIENLEKFKTATAKEEYSKDNFDKASMDIKEIQKNRRKAL